MYLGRKTIYLGERQSFMDRLDCALEQEHAVVRQVDKQIIGSHLVTTSEVQLADGIIFLEEDTYLGKSLTGPGDLVDRLASAAFGVATGG